MALRADRVGAFFLAGLGGFNELRIATALILGAGANCTRRMRSCGGGGGRTCEPVTQRLELA